MANGSGHSLRLLYLTAVDAGSGESIISPTSRITIGTLCRDFTVSLAVAGTINTVGMNRLRVDLGPVRVAGGFESSGADRQAPSAMRKLLSERLGSEMINARLQAAIQRKADDFDMVVIDDLAAWAYRPAMKRGKLAYLAREVFSAEPQSGPGLLAKLRGPSLRDIELSVFEDVDYVFARPEVSHQLSEIGVPLRLLQESYSRPSSGSPTFDDATYSLTGNRIGYIGYLGFPQNIASLDWFLTGVWPLMQARRPGVELHIVGSAPDNSLQHRLSAMADVHLHWGASDRKLLELGCRVVVDPLLYENHVDAKLVNSMTRSLPIVTTVSAAHRAHHDLGSCVIASSSPEEMTAMIDELMSEPRHWKVVSDRARDLAHGMLPDFEVAHAMRRVLVKLQQQAADDGE